MDCTTNCKYKEHGRYLTSVVVSEPVSTVDQLLTQRCSNSLHNTDNNGRNILHIAASCGRVDILQCLFDKHKLGNILPKKDRESGWTALHRAVFYGHIECAIFIYKILLDWDSVDSENNTPIDLAHLDCPRTKKKTKHKERLAVVVLPFESGEAGELTLNVGDVVEVLNTNRTGWGVGRLQHNRNKGLFPVNFVEEVKEDVCTDKVELFAAKNDVYIWGNNVNYTLGLGDAKNQQYPELIEYFWDNNIDIQHIEVTTFHSVFLNSRGEIYTCGLGLRGRLGHGTEETHMYPQKVEALIGSICISVAAAAHHTLVLDQLGQVYSFGSNDFHQLGHHPPPKESLLPVPVTHKFLKAKLIIGIGVGKFHSLMYTRHELYTFGLNGGQLGYGKNEEFQTIPKLVSHLYKKDVYIKTVVASDGATLCLMENGDLYLLSDYVCRKLAIKMLDVKCICIRGGSLDYKCGIEAKQTEPLIVVVLHQSGVVECWKPSYKSFKSCFWLGHKLTNQRITHISLAKQIILRTDSGLVYFGYFHQKQTKDDIPLVITANPVKAEVIAGSFTLEEVVSKYKRKRQECEDIHLEKIPLLYRCRMCFIDCKGRTFAAIQSDPRTGLTEYPVIRESNFSQDFESLFNEATLHDCIHDGYIKIKSTKIPVHMFLLQCRLNCTEIFNTRLKDEEGTKVIDFSDDANISVEHVKCWIKKVYQGSDETINSPYWYNLNKKEHTKQRVNFSDDDVAFAMKMKQFSLIDFENPIDELGEQRVTSKKEKKKKQKKKSAYSVYQENSNDVMTSDKKIKKNKQDPYVIHSLDSWKNHLDISDIVLESTDGILVECHRCVLVARLDYFNNMLNSEWMESSLCKDEALKMPIPGNILTLIIDYLYTDKADCLQDADISFIGEVLACADQLLMSRLKEICERSLADKISLKNAVELFQFSCTFNVSQLKVFTCQFISLNLAYYLEARLLEDLSYEELGVLSIVYRNMVADMDSRVIKTSNFHKEVDKQEKLLRDALQCELNKIKARNKKTAMQNDVNEMIRNSCDVITPEVMEKNVKAKTLSNTPKMSCWSTIPQPSGKPEDFSKEKIKKNVTSSPFKKKSQKERKNGQRNIPTMVEEQKDAEITSPVEMPWGSSLSNSNQTRAKSLRDIMNEELPYHVKPAKSIKGGAFPRSSTNQRRRSSESADEPPAERNPWQRKNVTATVNSPHQNSFSEILDVQKEEKIEQHQRSKKPITSIQLEEKAIEELRQYYELKSNFTEFITVKRIKTIADIPFWDRVMGD